MVMPISGDNFTNFIKLKKLGKLSHIGQFHIGNYHVSKIIPQHQIELFDK